MRKANFVLFLLLSFFSLSMMNCMLSGDCGVLREILISGFAIANVFICMRLSRSFCGEMCAVAFWAYTIVSPDWSHNEISFRTISSKCMTLKLPMFIGVSRIAPTSFVMIDAMRCWTTSNLNDIDNK